MFSFLFLKESACTLLNKIYGFKKRHYNSLDPLQPFYKINEVKQEDGKEYK